MTEAQLRASLIARFHRYRPIGGPEECWEWTGPRQTTKKPSYGVLGSAKRGRKTYAHRLAFELAYGILLAEEDHVCHECDDPPCCNPAHLFVGTNGDNAADARAKGLRLKEKCRKGHPKTPENTYVRVDKRGYMERHCRACIRLRQRKQPG